MNQGKHLNIVFITDEEKTEPVAEKAPAKPVGKIQEVTPYEKSEKERIQEKINEYIVKKNSPTADDCAYMLELAGYEFHSKKNFIKECNNLYKKTKEIQELAQDIKENALRIKEKPNAANKATYRSIELAGNHRILFLEKNNIDGIYNHNEYMRRLNNQQ